MDKKGLIGLIVVVGILLVLGFVWFVFQMDGDVDCVKVQTTCCPCNMGGSEKCVLSSEAGGYEENLSDCPDDLACVALYSCKIESCEYVDGECIIGGSG